MRKFVFLFLLICICINCTSTSSGNIEIHATSVPLYDTIPKNIEGAYIDLLNNHFDFGEINSKKIPNITIDVKFTNIGQAPLLILKSDVSCGCLSVDYPKEPIMPNQTGKLIIHADLRAQHGTFNKTVFIKSNALNDVTLIRILGSVR